jgi:hypothetical protein
MRLLALAALALLLGCGHVGEGRVKAADHDAFWLWAGVKPQPVLARARTLYILAAEIKGGPRARYVSLRPATPRVRHADIWIVYRLESLDWSADVTPRIQRDIKGWRAAGNDVAGVQIDFDAATRGLESYAAFLKNLRAHLPPDVKLGITGLMDWSSRADPGGLKAIAPLADEIIIQTYQGRATIPGYAGYLAQLGRLDIPYKLGLLQGGAWRAPEGLDDDPNFRGYVVFLLNPDSP